MEDGPFASLTVATSGVRILAAALLTFVHIKRFAF